MRTLEYPGSPAHMANPSIGASVRENRMIIGLRRRWQTGEANESAPYNTQGESE